MVAPVDPSSSKTEPQPENLFLSILSLPLSRCSCRVEIVGAWVVSFKDPCDVCSVQ